MSPRETAIGTAVLLTLLAALLFASWDGWKALDRPEVAPAAKEIGAPPPCCWDTTRGDLAWTDSAMTSAYLCTVERLFRSTVELQSDPPGRSGPIHARGSLERYTRWWSGGRLYFAIPAESIEVVL